MWGLAVAGPLMIMVSNPTIFVAAGIGIALIPSVWRTRDRHAQCAFLVYNALTAGTFLLLQQLVNSGQYAATHKFMLSYWAEGFPR